MISPSNTLAASSDIAVFPTPVGPQNTTIFCTAEDFEDIFSCFSKIDAPVKITGMADAIKIILKLRAGVKHLTKWSP